MDFAPKFETKFLNPISHYIIAEEVAGVARAVFAVAEIIYGIVQSLLYGLDFIPRAPKKGEKEWQPQYSKNFILGTEKINHGVLNLIRACIELFPLGCIFTSNYDKSGTRIRYIKEIQDSARDSLSKEDALNAI
jgi:hypothetical protein